MSFVISFDTETTGTEKEDEVIESAWTFLTIEPGKIPGRMIAHTAPVSNRYKPTRPITLGARACHHILDGELEGLPPSSESRLPDDVSYLVGHNIDFDWRMMGEPPVKRICTLALARMMRPDFDSHSLSACVYGFAPEIQQIYGMDIHKLKSFLTGAVHSAAHDIQLAVLIVEIAFQELQCKTWNDLYLFSEHARIPTVMPFGKHKGMAIEDVPSDYISWLTKQPDIDPYLLQAIREQRKPGKKAPGQPSIF